MPSRASGPDRPANGVPLVKLGGIGQSFDLGSLAERWRTDPIETRRGLSVVDQAMTPRALAASLLRQCREDEHSYVLEGGSGALLGDDVVKRRRRAGIRYGHSDSTPNATAPLPMSSSAGLHER